MNADAMSRRPEKQDHLETSTHEEATDCPVEPPPKPSNQNEELKYSPT